MEHKGLVAEIISTINYARDFLKEEKDTCKKREVIANFEETLDDIEWCIDNLIKADDIDTLKEISTFWAGVLNPNNRVAKWKQAIDNVILSCEKTQKVEWCKILNLVLIVGYISNYEKVKLKKKENTQFIVFDIWNNGSYIKCIAFGSNAVYINSLKKDNQFICIQGNLNTSREYIKGFNVYGYYIVVKNVEFIYDKDDKKSVMKSDFRNALYDFKGDIE